MQKSLVIVFSRPPILGKVKTRLAQTIGNEKALLIHTKLFDYTLETVTNSGIPFKIYLSAKPESPVDYPFLLQQGNNLGEKMKNAVENELLTCTKVLLIGSDCYNLSSSDLSEALNQLDGHDVVIGPAADGGYYLIGLKKMYLNLFHSMPWSTTSVLNKTLARCKTNKLNYALLNPRNDVDTLEDLPDEWRTI